MDISIVIPLLNEEDSISELYDWIAFVMQSNQLAFRTLSCWNKKPEQTVLAP